MALPPNAQPVPQPKKPATIDKTEQDRQKAIAIRRRAEDAKLSASNASARAKALGKKGQQLYNHQSIQGNPDFGEGAAGPGTPYSIKTTKMPEKWKFPPTLPARPVGKLPDWIKGKPLWPTKGNLNPMQATDWKQAAIRRRLSNG